jgi:hypothetical protein
MSRTRLPAPAFGSTLAIVALALIGFTRGAGGQAVAANSGANLERFERTLEQVRRETRDQVLRDVAPGERALIDYGGYFTASYVSLDDANSDNHGSRGYDLVGYGRLNFDGVHDFYLRGRGTYRNFNPGDSFNEEGDHLEGHVEEAYYRFDYGRYSDVRRSTDEGAASGELRGVLTVGRQFEVWANGLVLSQYVDAVRGVIDVGKVEVEFLCSITANDYTIDFDTSRPDFDEETRRGFYGALVSARLGAHRPFLYALVQRDHNGHDTLDTGFVRTHFDYNSAYFGIGSNGSLSDRFSYGAEFVYDMGRSLSRGGQLLVSPDTVPPDLQPDPQTREDISAFAADFHLDYTPGDPHRSRLGVGLLFASGDEDRLNSSNTVGGNRSGTDDNAFNALGFVDDGLAFSPQLSNVIILRAVASTYPAAGRSSSTFEQLQVGAEAFVYFKFDEDAPIAEPTVPGERYLGFEPDVFVNWQIFDDVSLALRYGVFVPSGDAFDSSKARHFFYAGLTYAF